MDINSEDLELLRQIANYREFLRAPRSPLVGRDFGSLQNTMRRINAASAELKVLEARWVNRGLEAAGMRKAVDPETKPLPVCEQVNGRVFLPPDPVLAAECQVRKPIAARVKAVDIPCSPEMHRQPLVPGAATSEVHK